MIASRKRPLGDLELAVLDCLWRTGPSDVAAAHAAVGAPRGVSPNTIQSTLERLVRKQLAERSKVGRAYVYRPRLSRSEWIRRTFESFVEDVLGVDPPILVAAFVDFAERTGDEILEELEALVRRRRDGRKDGA